MAGFGLMATGNVNAERERDHANTLQPAVATAAEKRACYTYTKYTYSGCVQTAVDDLVARCKILCVFLCEPPSMAEETVSNGAERTRSSR